ncbi:MAG: TerB family tellurite resistance protein [Bdellovibrionota bacterium]|nr:MAG: TerB family tellurite resistance protein [Bdellovibrionota bacterium]
MFRDLRAFVRGRPAINGKRPSAQELQVACIAVLLHVARIDRECGSNEIRQLVAALNREFRISDVEAGELIEVAELLLKEPGKLDEFSTLLRESLTVEEKQTLLAYAWKIVESDGNIGFQEASLATQLRKDLNLTLEQAMAARQLMTRTATPMEPPTPEE